MTSPGIGSSPRRREDQRLVTGAGTFSPVVNPLTGANLPGFITEYDETGATVLFSSLIGSGGNTDQAYGVACTVGGTMFVVGERSNANPNSSFVEFIKVGLDALKPTLNGIITDTGYSTSDNIM